MHRTATQLLDHLAALLPVARTVSPLTRKSGAPAPEAQSLTRFAPETDFIRYALGSAAIVAITDVQGTITYINGKFCEISGYTEEELLGSNHRILNSGTHDVAYFRAMYREIARGTIDIAHSLGKAVTAEGVETAEQVELLSAMGCDQLQGWYFGKVCEAERLPAVLESIPLVGDPATERHRTTSASNFASRLTN